MNVGILGERSGIIRDAFIRRGHHAVSFDMAETESPGPHVVGDFFEHDYSWADLLICHPTCTYLAVSGFHWNYSRPERWAKTWAALDDVRRLFAMKCPRLVIENPVSVISTIIRKADQTIQPWQFGEDASKATCLWLRGVPKLKPTCVLPGGRTTRRANQSPCGANKLGPSPERAMLRAKTYHGIAEAMADQWGQASVIQRELFSTHPREDVA